jgi:hypothetical protein
MKLIVSSFAGAFLAHAARSALLLALSVQRIPAVL